MRQLTSLLVSERPLDKHRELVATQAGHSISRVQQGTEPVRHLLQDEVPGCVPERIVDVFEPVEVKEQQRGARHRFGHPLECCVHAVAEQLPVGQPGQRVVSGLMADGGLDIVPFDGRRQDVGNLGKENSFSYAETAHLVMPGAQDPPGGAAPPDRHRKAAADAERFCRVRCFITVFHDRPIRLGKASLDGAASQLRNGKRLGSLRIDDRRLEAGRPKDAAAHRQRVPGVNELQHPRGADMQHVGQPHHGFFEQGANICTAERRLADLRDDRLHRDPPLQVVGGGLAVAHVHEIHGKSRAEGKHAEVEPRA